MTISTINVRGRIDRVDHLLLSVEVEQLNEKACMQRMRNYFHSSLVVKNLQRNGSSSFETSKRLKVEAGKQEHVTPLDCSRRSTCDVCTRLGNASGDRLSALEFLRLAMIKHRDGSSFHSLTSTSILYNHHFFWEPFRIPNEDSSPQSNSFKSMDEFPNYRCVASADASDLG